MIPVGDRLVVEPIEEDDTTESGIYKPETAKERPNKGVVLARGAGRYEQGHLVPMTVGVGDTVMFGKYSGTEFQHEGKKLFVLDEGDILCILVQA